MKAIRWRLAFYGLALAVWLLLSLTTAIYAGPDAPLPNSRDDCGQYIRNPENIVVAPRAMIEDCLRTPGPAAFAQAITAFVIALALTGAFGAAAQQAVELAVRTPEEEERDSDRAWLDQQAFEAYMAGLRGETFNYARYTPEQAAAISSRAGRYSFSYGTDWQGALADTPSLQLGRPGSGEILSGDRAKNYLIREGAAVKDKDGRQWIPASAIKDRQDIQGGAYHTVTREVWNPQAYRYDQVEVIDPDEEVAIIKR